MLLLSACLQAALQLPLVALHKADIPLGYRSAGSGTPRRAGMTCALFLPPETEAAKLQLLVAIDAFNAAREEAGGVSIDFGVKGGELDQDSRAPVNLADGGFYAISERLGKAADSVIRAIQLLEPLNPTPDATKFFGTVEGTRCPLHGSWVNLFTTAADATFSKTSKRGDARASNTVDGVRGRIWNCIDFTPPSNGSSTPLEQLRVLLAAKAVSPTRIEIAFRLVKARVNRFFGLPLFGRRLTLTFPVPGPFLTRILFAFRKNKKPPPAFFEIIYLDETLRVHKTGQGAFFVQQRPTWS